MELTNIIQLFKLVWINTGNQSKYWPHGGDFLTGDERGLID